MTNHRIATAYRSPAHGWTVLLHVASEADAATAADAINAACAERVAAALTAERERARERLRAVCDNTFRMVGVGFAERVAVRRALGRVVAEFSKTYGSY
jgi:hypothetical protein